MPPTFVLVFGLWEGPHIYSLLKPRLESLGYEAVIAPLFSTGKPAGPDGPTMLDDTAGIRKVLDPLVDAGKTVVLAPHSAGGFLAAGATKGLSVRERKAEGKEGGVVRFAFVTAGVLPAGVSHGPLPFMRFEGDEMHCTDARTLLYNDLSDVDAATQIATLRCQPGHGWDATQAYAGYEVIESAYLVCERDMILPVGLQEQFARTAGCKVVERCDAGHCAPVTRTEAVACFLRRVAEGME